MLICHLDGAHGFPEIRNCQTQVRLVGTGILFHVRYQVKGQNLRKAAAQVSKDVATGGLLVSKITKARATVKALDENKPELWLAVHKTSQEIKAECSSNEACFRIHQADVEAC
jgi:hypothetical protein